MNFPALPSSRRLLESASHPLAHAPLLATAYLPPVQYVAKLLGGSAWVDQWENFQKQTYRNRCVIDSEGGPQALVIPVERPDNGSRLIRDLRISQHDHWRHRHWQALVSSYANTPYFEFYEDDFRPFYEREWHFLLDFNMEMLSTCLRLLELDVDIHLTDAYQADTDAFDWRTRISPKRPFTEDASFQPEPYYQMFADRHGFLANLSIVDLLFNLGPEGVAVLQRSVRPCRE